MASQIRNLRSIDLANKSSKCATKKCTKRVKNMVSGIDNPKEVEFGNYQRDS